MHNLVLFGGTFDPVHLGHVNTALAIQNHMHFERFIFLPCKSPVLKNTTMASSEQRIDMLKLAIRPWPEFELDLREIKRETPSFMVDTLQSFREELGNQVSITLLLGMDAFLQLPQWHEWQKILELSHLLVIQRIQVTETLMPPALKTLFKTHSGNKNSLLTHAYGKIYQFNAGEYAISSSCLRQKMAAREDIQLYLPEGVYQYIQREKIYEVE
jgi:nicotinate-nucleotide adenylyltransferase